MTDLYYKDRPQAMLNTMIFSIVSLIVGAVMLSSWSKRERTYNYKFNEESDLNAHDTELSS